MFSLSVKIFMNSVRIIYYDFDFIFCLKIFLSVSGCGNFLFSMFVSIIIWVFLFLFFGVVIVLLLLEFMPLSLQGFLYGLNVWIPTLVLVFWYSWISSNTHLDYLNGFFFFKNFYFIFNILDFFFFCLYNGGFLNVIFCVFVILLVKINNAVCAAVPPSWPHLLCIIDWIFFFFFFFWGLWDSSLGLWALGGYFLSTLKKVPFYGNGICFFHISS